MVKRNSGARIPIIIIRRQQRLRSVSCAISEHMNVENTTSMTAMLCPSEAAHGGSKNSARAGMNIDRLGRR